MTGEFKLEHSQVTTILEEDIFQESVGYLKVTESPLEAVQGLPLRDGYSVLKKSEVLKPRAG